MSSTSYCISMRLADIPNYRVNLTPKDLTEPLCIMPRICTQIQLQGYDSRPGMPA